MIIPPTREIPKSKEPASPRTPIPAGMAPPPRRKAAGIVKDTEMFRTLGAPIRESAANPGEKKQTATMGCKNTMGTIQDPGTTPRSSVIKPVVRKTPPRATFEPSLSVAIPDTNTIPRLEIREMATR